MDEKYIAFAKMGMDELKFRIAANAAVNTPEKMNDDDVIKKFFADQGIEFGTIDVEKVKALLV